MGYVLCANHIRFKIFSILMTRLTMNRCKVRYQCNPLARNPFDHAPNVAANTFHRIAIFIQQLGAIGEWLVTIRVQIVKIDLSAMPTP